MTALDTPRPRLIGVYVDGDGRPRELLARPGCAGTLLVIDHDGDGRDHRLLAHLAADEPHENAEIVCRDYLAVPRAKRACRRLTAEDLRSVPSRDAGGAGEHSAERPLEAGDCRFELASERRPGMVAQLRWWKQRGERRSPVSLRDVVAAMESYEPACARTRAEVQRCRGSAVSTTVLRGELRRVSESPIVLNRRLREAVLAALDAHGLSMSEIAIRCGRVKRDRQGNESGETSWLARRLGLLGDTAHSPPTPWIHSDVLATIARRGLGVSPREVEA